MIARIVAISNRILDALHRLVCPMCARGARRELVGGKRHHVAGRKRLPLDRILTR